MESAGLQRFPVASLIRRNLSVVAAVIALWVAGSLLAIAQDEVATRVRAATEGSTKPYVYPAIDPALAINGAALLSELRKGGYVLFMRHTETGTVTPECTQPNLIAR